MDFAWMTVQKEGCENVSRLLFSDSFHWTAVGCLVAMAYSIHLSCIPTLDSVPILALVSLRIRASSSFHAFLSSLCAYFLPFWTKCTVSSFLVVRLCSFAHLRSFMPFVWLPLSPYLSGVSVHFLIMIPSLSDHEIVTFVNSTRTSPLYTSIFLY